MPLLSPKSDFVFKLIFGDQRNADILAAFLQAVLDLPIEEYGELTFVDPHLKREDFTDKTGILDVKIHTKSGKIIDVEIQLLPTAALRERIAYYGAKMITEQIGIGENYAKIQRVICIVITDFVMIPGSPAYHHTFRLYDKKHGAEFSDVIEVNTLELPKLPKQAEKNELYHWMQFFKAKNEEDLNMLETQSPMLGKVVGKLKELSADERTRMLAEDREKARRDAAAALQYAQTTGRENGLREGREEGRREGVEEGIRKGRMETARNALRKNISIEDIMDLTGLSREEIETLR